MTHLMYLHTGIPGEMVGSMVIIHVAIHGTQKYNCVQVVIDRVKV